MPIYIHNLLVLRHHIHQHSLLQLKTYFSALFTILAFFLLLINANPESFSFNFPSFNLEDEVPITLLGDAHAPGRVIQLTTLSKNSAGRAIYFTPIHFWDNTTGNVAAFTTEFSFLVDEPSLPLYGHGLSFFIAPFDSDISVPKDSFGGYLGLFSPKTALDQSKNQIMAIEFDSFGNEWDPNPVNCVALHVGIDINSMKSVKSLDWPIDLETWASVGKAQISYDSKAKELSVFLSYTDVQPNTFVSLSYPIDLRSVLPEWVRIGFSASTGDLIKTHDILSWSLSSHL